MYSMKLLRPPEKKWHQKNRVNEGGSRLHNMQSLYCAFLVVKHRIAGDKNHVFHKRS